jgi:hypothetical protein
MLQRSAGMLALAGAFCQNYKLNTIAKRGANRRWFMPRFLILL